MTSFVLWKMILLEIRQHLHFYFLYFLRCHSNLRDQDLIYSIQFQLQEHTDGLDKESDNKKLKDLFVEAMRTVELINMDELNTLAETMFADMPESEKGKEQERLKEITGKRSQAMTLIADGKKKWKISAF